MRCTATVTGTQITLTVRTNATRDIVAHVESGDNRYTKVILERSSTPDEYLAVVEWSDIALAGLRATAYNVLDLDTLSALSWSSNHRPLTHGETTTIECSVIIDHITPLSYRSTPLSACGWLFGNESTQRWSERLWQPGNCQYTQLLVKNAVLEQIPGRCIIWLGDSQMRTTYQSMVAQVCPDFAWLDFATIPHGWCKSNVTNQGVCGGRFSVVGGNGCWDGGAVLRIGRGERDILLIYGDVHSDDDRRFVEWLVTNGLKEEVRQRRCTVLLASGLHDQNSEIGDSLAADTINRLKLIRSELQPQEIVQVGAWASETSKRGLGYWWAAVPSRVAMMNRVVGRAIEEAQFEPVGAVRFVDLFRMTLAVCHRSPDGVHLAQPHPLDEVARLLWYNIRVSATERMMTE